MCGSTIVESLDVADARQPLVHPLHILVERQIMGKRSRVDLGGQIPFLQTHRLDLLVQLLGDFDEAPAINFAIPLKLPQLAAKLKQRSNQILELILINAIRWLRCAPITTM
jgi:hypothetical protein